MSAVSDPATATGYELQKAPGYRSDGASNSHLADRPIDDYVTLEIIADNPAVFHAAETIVRAHGGAVDEVFGGQLTVRIPKRARIPLEAIVSRGNGHVRTPQKVDVRPESETPRTPTVEIGEPSSLAPAITNASAWHDVGVTGNGVKIGVIDFFDITRYWDETEHGPTPVAGVTARCLEVGVDCTNEFFDGTDSGSENHGPNVVEVIHDMAPAAQIYVGQAFSIADYRDLVDWFADRGVSIINRSLGGRYDGPGDGRGGLNEVAEYANSKGMLWVNSGGNNGRTKYVRQPVRLHNGRVAFGTSGSDTFLEFKNCANLGGVRWANDWDKPSAERTDYDIYLWNSPTGSPQSGTIVASSTDPQQIWAPPLELISGSKCPSPGSTMYLEIRWKGGDTKGDIIEVLDYDRGFAEYAQAEYSATTPIVDSKLQGVLAVGSIESATTGTIARYSSRGPTNDGRIAPDLVAATGFPSILTTTFSGTSASAAVVSGGAALLLDAKLATGANALASLISHITIDRGDTGPDNTYGHGEFHLPDPPAEPIDDTPSRFVGIDTPTRILDTRSDTAVGPPGLIGRYSAGEIRDLPVLGVTGVPAANVTAVAVNLVTVSPDKPSFIQALPTLGATVAGYSNLNADTPGQVRANFAIVPVGQDGSISLYSIANGHVVVDLLGWFETSPEPTAAGRFVEFAKAERLLDTRQDAPIGPLRANQTRNVPMPAGLDPSDAEALVVTVTGAGASAPGWVQAIPTDRPDSIGATSTLNLAKGGTIANTAIVPIGDTGMSVAGYFVGSGGAHIIVDAIGYITSAKAPPSDSGLFVSVSPGRAFDSREGLGPLRDQQIVVVDASGADGINVPPDATAVIWNIVAISASRPGFMRSWAANHQQPTTSSLNWVWAGDTLASSAIAAVDNGRSRFLMEDGSANLQSPVAHFVADVFGYFT